MPPPPIACDVEITDAPDPKDCDAIAQQLLAYNKALLGPPEIRPIAVLIRSPDKTRVIGGLWGRTSFQWLSVKLLFVPEGLRGQHLGTRLLEHVEREAKARGCLGSWLETFSAEARRFYERRGYHQFGAIADYPPGNTRAFLSKRLAAAAGSTPAANA